MADEIHETRFQEVWEAPAPRADLRDRILATCKRELNVHRGTSPHSLMNRRFLVAVALVAVFLGGFFAREVWPGPRQIPSRIPSRAISPQRDTFPATPVGPQSMVRATSRLRPHPTSSVARSEEIVTNFYPLLDTMPQLDRGTLLRVTVPAPMVQIAGLPLRDDQLYESVDADLLIGEDGTPQAIRFVNFEYPVLNSPSERSLKR